MAATHEQLLAQLQNEVNNVLLHTGALFRAAIGPNDKATSARALKLKRTLPGSTARFHEVLDSLEDELQMAKLVMRRDLAVCRERNGTQRVIVNDAPPAAPDAPPTGDDAEPDKDQGSAEQAALPEDIEMEDILTNEASETVKPTDDGDTPQQPAEPTEQPSESQAEAQAEPKPESPEPTSQPSEIGLHVDTTAQVPTKEGEDTAPNDTADDQPPDTGTFSNNDLESLFGPNSAATATGALPDFSTDVNHNDIQFDFDTFTTNNDNTADHNAADNGNDSSDFMNQLQDYANRQPANDPTNDFDAWWSAQSGGNDGGDMNADVDGSGAHRDSTFDDIDFEEFDFGNGDAEGGN